MENIWSPIVICIPRFKFFEFLSIPVNEYKFSFRLDNFFFLLICFHHFLVYHSTIIRLPSKVLYCSQKMIQSEVYLIIIIFCTVRGQYRHHARCTVTGASFIPSRNLTSAVVFSFHSYKKNIVQKLQLFFSFGGYKRLPYRHVIIYIIITQAQCARYVHSGLNKFSLFSRSHRSSIWAR